MEPNLCKDSRWGSRGEWGIAAWTVFGWRVFLSGLYGPTPGTATSVCQGNADSTTTGISFWTFPHLLVLPGKLLSFVFAQKCSLRSGLLFPLTESTSLIHRSSVCCLLCACVTSWTNTAATPARELSLLFCYPFLYSFTHFYVLSQPAVQPSSSAQKF